jgi:hypothetical protein
VATRNGAEYVVLVVAQVLGRSPSNRNPPQWKTNKQKGQERPSKFSSTPDEMADTASQKQLKK